MKPSPAPWMRHSIVSAWPAVPDSRCDACRCASCRSGRFSCGAEATGRPWVVLDHVAAAWSHGGYTDALVLPEAATVEVLTPGPTLAALRAGYRPILHPSAAAVQAHVLA